MCGTSLAMPRFGAQWEQNGWEFYGCRLDLSVEAILISIHGTYVKRETRVLLFLYACVRRTRTILLLNTMTQSSPTDSRKKKVFMFTNNIKVALHWWCILLDSTDIDLILSFLTHAIRGKWSPLLGIMDYSLPHYAISQMTQLATSIIMLIVDDKQRGNLDYLALYESKNLDVSYYLCSKIYSI